MVKDNYDVGVMSTADLLEARALFQQAQDAVVDAKANYKIAQSHYLKVVASSHTLN